MSNPLPRHDQAQAGALSAVREAKRESRREARARIAVPVRFRHAGGAVDATARNVSVGGMFIETDRPAAFGEVITIELQLPTMPRMANLSATVRWTSEDGMGVQFGVTGARETHGLLKLLEG
jgi:uncharacterized protein (TIGR02266 family)